MDNAIGPKQRLLLQRVDEDADAALVIGLLGTARRLDNAYNAFLAEHRLSGGRFVTLLAVTSSPGITLARLAEQIEVKPATATGLVDGLVTLDLVARGSDARDRRVQTLTATDAGHALIARVVPRLDAWFSELTAGLGEDERAGVWRTLSLLQTHLAEDGTRT